MIYEKRKMAKKNINLKDKIMGVSIKYSFIETLLLILFVFWAVLWASNMQYYDDIIHKKILDYEAMALSAIMLMGMLIFFVRGNAGMWRVKVSQIEKNYGDNTQVIYYITKYNTLPTLLLIFALTSTIYWSIDYISLLRLGIHIIVICISEAILWFTNKHFLLWSKSIEL